MDALQAWAEKWVGEIILCVEGGDLRVLAFLESPVTQKVFCI